MTSLLEWSSARKEAVHLALGREAYATTHARQLRLHALRVAGAIPDTILSVEHDPVFTVGRRGSRANLLVPPEALEEEGIDLVDVERGGDITYHGPGQVVLYPIVDLRQQGRDIGRYVRNLEEGVIVLLGQVGVAAVRRAGLPGVWVGGRKIASVGVAVRHWVTLHGVALNVRVNRRHFAMINPCGMQVEVVSLDDLVAPRYSLQEVTSGLLRALEPLLGWRIVEQRVEESVEARA